MSPASRPSPGSVTAVWIDRPTGSDGAKAREVAHGLFQLGTGRGITETNVYFVRSGDDWVLVDTAWSNRAAAIRAAAERLFGPNKPPAAILLTHFHPDHSGSARELARLWDLPVHVHPDEFPFAGGGYVPAYAHPLDRWVVAPMMRVVPRHKREAMQSRNSLEGTAVALCRRAGLPGLPDWEFIPTPGHTPGHVSYFRPADRVLITGDALVTVRLNTPAGLFLGRPGLSGPPWFTTWNRRAAEESVRRLAQLEPSVVAGGHGVPMAGARTPAAVKAFAEQIH